VAVKEAFESTVPTKSAVVSFGDSKSVLFGFVPAIVKHTAFTLLRRFSEGSSFL
jgi:hypothetical protein